MGQSLLMIKNVLQGKKKEKSGGPSGTANYSSFVGGILTIFLKGKAAEKVNPNWKLCLSGP